MLARLFVNVAMVAMCMVLPVSMLMAAVDLAARYRGIA